MSIKPNNTTARLTNSATGFGITNSNVSVYTLIKDSAVTSGLTASYLEYINGSGKYIRMSRASSAIQFSSLQAFAASVNQTVLPANSTWAASVGVDNATNYTPKVYTKDGTVTAGGQHGAMTVSDQSILNVGRRSDGSAGLPVGSAIGAMAMWNVSLSASDAATLVAATTPMANPMTINSGTGLLDIWVDSYGVVKDGSNFLVSWTGLFGTVLTPLTATDFVVDDTDKSPLYDVVSSIIVNGGQGVIAGSAANTATIQGITDVTAMSYAGLAITTFSYSNGTITFTMPDPKNFDQMTYPVIGASASLSITTPEGIKTATVALKPPAGFVAKTVASPNIVNRRYLGAILTPAPVNGDVLYMATTDGEIKSTTQVRSPSQRTAVVLHQIADGTMYAYNVYIPDILLDPNGTGGGDSGGNRPPRHKRPTADQPTAYYPAAEFAAAENV